MRANKPNWMKHATTIDTHINVCTHTHTREQTFVNKSFELQLQLAGLPKSDPLSKKIQIYPLIS